MFNFITETCVDIGAANLLLKKFITDKIIFLLLKVKKFAPRSESKIELCERFNTPNGRAFVSDLNRMYLEVNKNIFYSI